LLVQVKLEKLLNPKGENKASTSPSNVFGLTWPWLTFDPLHHSCRDAIGIYHNICKPVKLKFIEQFLRYIGKRYFYDLFWPWTLTS